MADLAIGITASDHAGLFNAALEGLLGTIDLKTDSRENEKIEENGINLAGKVIEEILVDFLNDCIYLMEVGEQVPFRLEDVEYNDGVLKAKLKSRPIREEERTEIGHIKAATYSALEVKFIDGVYSATIIFDT
jgi:SHS2 domain-containing protein